jgi:predicted RNA-binding Zn ribbon-like protein
MESIAELPFIGRHVALDFVNTAEERGHAEAGEALREPADLRLWGQRSGLLERRSGLLEPASAGSRADADDGERSELAQALNARELLYRLFLARVRAAPATPADLDELATLAADAYRAGRIEASADGHLHWGWSGEQLSTIRHVAVTAGVRLLGDVPPGRLKQCPGEHCGWFFLDTTKRGNRLWCSMSECGQDQKRARRRTRSESRRRSSPPAGADPGR